MTKWQDYFTIHEVDNHDTRDLNDEDSWMTHPFWLFEVRDPNNKVVGTYKDEKYAKKQARYKFKKMMANVEKILLS